MTDAFTESIYKQLLKDVPELATLEKIDAEYGRTGQFFYNNSRFTVIEFCGPDIYVSLTVPECFSVTGMGDTNSYAISYEGNPNRGHNSWCGCHCFEKCFFQNDADEYSMHFNWRYEDLLKSVKTALAFCKKATVACDKQKFQIAVGDMIDPANIIIDLDKDL